MMPDRVLPKRTFVNKKANGFSNPQSTASFDEVVEGTSRFVNRRAVGELFYAGELEKTFRVKIDDNGRFRVSVGSSGHKIVFSVPGWL